MKKIMFLVMMLSLILIGCADKKEEAKTETDNTNTEAKADDKVYKIGITQIVSHQALDKAREGFKDALKEAGIKAEFDEQNAQGDVTIANTIANKFVTDKVDLIFAIATPTAQAVSNATSDTPILFSAVTDPEAAGLVKPNVTGSSDKVDIEQQLALLREISKDAKKIGFLYNSSEENSLVQLEEIKKIAGKYNFEIVEQGISSANELPQAIDKMLTQVDALYLPTDNLISSSSALIAEKANAAKKITFAAESGMLENGIFITKGIDYYQLGKEAGKLAVEILKDGKKPSDLPYKIAETTEIAVNKQTLEQLGIKLPDDVMSKAKFIETKAK
ncbi:ABC transporter substrate-binding protein [Sebaldella sp. S0638]|uniref:ABC transporter substrate-binding protein n=1 Tax=Sebaldella sp. S0638 TaxID=2957809 RepID=UPI0020A1D8F4|nr:ABC transporter substrate-binding protein [Sebaldella sp. S0638]MCP1223436.1 ABC transporter substrate-binding protein [Sebaldella sp. S0638]